VQKSWMHAFLQNRKFAIFAKRTTGMAAGYFTKVKGAGLFEMDFSRSKYGNHRPHGGNLIGRRICICWRWRWRCRRRGGGRFGEAGRAIGGRSAEPSRLCGT